MFNVGISDVICSQIEMVKKFIEIQEKGQSPLNRGAYALLLLKAKDGENISSSFLHLCFSFASNYTTVWADIPDKSLHVAKQRTVPTNWGTHIAHHDDCWKLEVESIIWDLYFRLCRKVNSSKPPIEIETSAHIQLLHSVNLEKKLTYSYDNFEEYIIENFEFKERWI